MNGVSGRRATTHHRARSSGARRARGGLAPGNGDALYPEPILLGRNDDKLKALARAHGLTRTSTDLGRCLANAEDTIYFDAQTTGRRADAVRAAIAAGKHIYCEKPVASDVATALELAQLARRRGVK